MLGNWATGARTQILLPDLDGPEADVVPVEKTSWLSVVAFGFQRHSRIR